MNLLKFSIRSDFFSKSSRLNSLTLFKFLIQIKSWFCFTKVKLLVFVKAFISLKVGRLDAKQGKFILYASKIGTPNPSNVDVEIRSDAFKYNQPFSNSFT